MPREPFTYIEIDVDFCTRTFGQGACTASLGGATVRKCFNTTATCAAREALNLGKLTLRFCEPRPHLPKGATWFPCLDNVDGRSATVNIAGSDDKLAALGRRATATVNLRDFPYHDRLTDKYAAERISGVAQTDEGGYDPQRRGTFFTKLKARWPFYAGRALRIVQGYIDGGVVRDAVTRHYIITEMTGPDDGAVTIEAKDVLDLADNKRALAPQTSRGVLAGDISADAGNLTLSPSGIGNLEYPASGRAVMGSEIVTFTRSGDTVTLTARGVSGSTAASHSADDTLQLTFSCQRERIDSVLRRLLVDYAKVDAAFIPYAEWQAEVTRWAASLRLTADITKPEGVHKLIGELAVLGVSIWWDETAQKIGLKMNRPPDTDAVHRLTDRDSIIEIEIEDRDEDRLTQVAFYTVQIDPTKSATDGNNYRRLRLTVDQDAQGAQEYADTRVKEIYCRWLNHGDDAQIRILSRRFLNRFRRAPVRYEIEVDAKDDMGLTDVATVLSDAITDETGKPTERLMQIISREEPVPGHRIALTAQAFFFNQAYGFITENSRPVFTASTATQKARGAYFARNDTLKMSDGSRPYRFI